MDNQTIVKLSNCIRVLALDAVANAKSGHLGMVLGMADIMTVLYSEFLIFNPLDAKWSERDRVIISNGHGSIMLYALLYLTGYPDISIDDIKRFRKIHSKTAGHPEYGLLQAIETTTGPLGQGIANAVGMAIAAKMQNKNNKIYCTVGDGCLMEGISYESTSLAGHLKLNNLIVIFDNNSITIDGTTSLSTSENISQRFLSINWNVITIDGHNIDEIRQSFKEAQNSLEPTIIIATTIIGFGSLKYQNTPTAHGNVFEKEEMEAIKKYFQFDSKEFEIPKSLLNIWRTAWKKNKKLYKKNLPQILNEDLSDFFNKMRQEAYHSIKDNSTRKMLGKILNQCYLKIPQLIGGSADLSDSTCVKTEICKDISFEDFSGNFINYGVREHSMAGIMNGIALFGGFIPLSSTFLVFSDYMKPAIRMAAIMKQKVIFIFSHDSIGVGEDGPTHQAVEQLSGLNAIPNLLVMRPCSEAEVIDSIEIAVTFNQPSAILCSRQNIKQNFAKELIEIKNYTKLGAYFIVKESFAKCVIIASGSEIEIGFAVCEGLKKYNIQANLVSMPCCKLFDLQSIEYQNEILGRTNNLLKIGIEAGSAQNMAKYLDYEDLFFGVNDFGHSANAREVFEYFNLTAESIVNKIIYNVV